MLSNIEAERVRNQITKKELAEELGIDVRTYYNWINENADIPSKKLKQLAEKFQVSMEYLIKDSASGKTKN